MKSQSSVYWKNAEARTSTSIRPLKVCYEIHYPTLSNLYKASTLLQAQGFRLVTPDPFLVRGLGLGTRLRAYVVNVPYVCLDCNLTQPRAACRQ